MLRWVVTAGRSSTAHGRARPTTIFVDLGIVSDPSVIAVGHEAGGLAYIDKLVTFQGSREQPVQLVDVEAELLRLTRAFRPVTRIRIESWQGVSAVQRLQVKGCRLSCSRRRRRRTATSGRCWRSGYRAGRWRCRCMRGCVRSC